MPANTDAPSGLDPALDWWRGGVIYQIYPRSFQDSNGDGIGDLPGIIDRLDHVAQLGVDAIWISPFFRSPMKDFGYDVSDYRDIDPQFGTMADFDALIARAVTAEMWPTSWCPRSSTQLLSSNGQYRLCKCSRTSQRARREKSTACPHPQ